MAETALLGAFAEPVTTRGIEADRAPMLPAPAPVIGTLVREAIPRNFRKVTGSPPVTCGLARSQQDGRRAQNSQPRILAEM
jgi:hypothetical protein